MEQLQAKFPSSALKADPHGAFFYSLHHVDQCNSPVTIHRMFPTGGKDKKKTKENARMGQGSPAHHSQRMSHDN